MKPSSKKPTLPPLESPQWSKQVKIFVAACIFVLILIAVWTFQSVISTFVVAGLIAYLLNVPIVQLERRLRMGRGVAVAIVYLLFAVIVVGGLIVTGVTIYQQGVNLVNFVQTLMVDGPQRFQEFINQTWTVGPFEFTLNQFEYDFASLFQQVFSLAQGVAGTGASFIGIAAQTAFGVVGTSIIVFVLSIYLAVDLPRFGTFIADTIYLPDHRRDFEILIGKTTLVWDGYLRGQTTLAVIMGLFFAISLSALGVENALALGLLAGILDFIPFLGPIIAVALSTLVALFQGSTWLDINPFFLALIVLALGTLAQQIEGNWLNPRIMGDALDLHPLLVMSGAIMGAALAGVLGMILAAPVLGTMKLLSSYIWHKMFDLHPFPDLLPPEREEKDEEAAESKR